MANHAKIDELTRGQRKPYARPRLREFGQVGKLTQSGTGTMSEAGMSTNNATRHPRA